MRACATASVLISVLFLSAAAPFLLHAQVADAGGNTQVSLFPALLIEGGAGNTSWHFSMGLGADSFDGVDFGFDFEISRQVGGWRFSGGFGGGLNHIAAGGSVSYKGVGAGYHAAFFGNTPGPDGRPNSQTAGAFTFFAGIFSLRIENDSLYIGERFDRWRTAAIEVGVWNFVIGTFIYTNMPDRRNPDYVYDENYTGSLWGGGRNAYSDSEVYRSVFYVGYRYKNFVIRVGVNHPVVQDIVQNGWHILVNMPLFYTPYGRYFSPYVFIGYYSPFTLF